MFSFLSLFICLVLTIATTINGDLTRNDLQLVVHQIRSLYSYNPSSSEFEAFAPKAVRLFFHDAVTYKTHANGGLNGCIKRDARENASMLDLIEKYRQILESLSFSFSRADLWTLGAIIALTDGLPSEFEHVLDDLLLHFQYGRVDVDECEADAGQVPSPFGGLDFMVDVFTNRLGFTTEQMVAFMGTHSLGGSPTFSFNFDQTPKIFDNLYYQNMIHASWTPVNATTPPNFPFWQSSANTIAFNIDLCLAYNFSLTEREECNGNNYPPTTCIVQPHQARYFVELYATDPSPFYSTFLETFIYLENLGQDDLISFADY